MFYKEIITVIAKYEFQNKLKDHNSAVLRKKTVSMLFDILQKTGKRVFLSAHLIQSNVRNCVKTAFVVKVIQIFSAILLFLYLE